ncbi:MAG: V-type ATP synthase subunit A, partial [Sphaerochaetaceae bacterium]|nr:V-type ATP synthase subunit A [Sphaerochaetaceae bacterium]
IVKLVGPDALPDSQNFILEVCNVFKTAFLQQDAFNEIDRFSTVSKQIRMLQLILAYWHLGSAAIAKGVTMVKIRRLKVVQEITRMRFSIANDDLGEFDTIALHLERSFNQLGGIYEEH